jgi:hypothetical protein
MKLLTLLFLAIWSVPTSSAQDFQFVSFRYGTPVRGDGSSRTELLEFQLRLPLPVWEMGPKTRLQGSVGFHHISFQQKLNFWRDSPYDTFKLDVLLSRELSSQWSLAIGASERFTKEFLTDSGGRQLFSQIALIANHSRTNGDLIRLGIAYRTGVPQSVIPLIGYERDLTPKLRLEALLPSRLNLWRHSGTGSSRYGLHASYRSTPYSSTDSGSISLRHTLVRVGISGESRITGNFFLRLDASVAISNVLHVKNSSVSDRTVLKRGGIFDVSLRYKLPSQ